MRNRSTKDTDQQHNNNHDPHGRLASLAKETDKVKHAQDPSPLNKVVRYFPYLIICILLFDKYNVSSKSSPRSFGASNPCQCSDVATPQAQVEMDAVGGEDQKMVNTEDSSLIKDKILTMMQAMDWEIPGDIKEERHKECDGRKTSSTGGFCLTKTTRIGGNWMVDTDLGNYLRDNLFRGANVVDLGAGLGHYGKIFIEEGSPVKSWVGFDGALNVESATDGLVRFMDLTQPHPADERPCVKGDWVLSLEVAEHIPPQFTDHYIRNLRCSCTVGAVVSWAHPSQTGGLGHVNTKVEEDAIAAMERWGFTVDKEASESVQAAAGMSHFKRNTLVYRVKQEVN